ncbi:sensor histidine kinase [Dyella tabacisoli]|nr:sensor histidine kinase [Dyella tabacisoli]
MLMLMIESLITYAGALIYSNHVHDRDLADNVSTMAQMLSKENVNGEISAQARFLLDYDSEGHNYFSVSSQKHGLLAGNPQLQPPSAATGDPTLFNTTQEHRKLRAASISIPAAHDPSDKLTLTMAETLRDRHQRAREILFLSIPAQALLIAAVFALVWYGVRIGLRALDPLTKRLAAREHDLAPISDVDVPVEILPLTRTIDGLFARLRGMLALQERFIADAAHQLRTPLAGLRVHVERAQADPSPATVNDALEHIQRLTNRASRTSTQLLALTRAQSPEHETGVHALIDLGRFIPELLSLRVHEALAAGVDLGYDGPSAPVWIDGDRTTLQELLDNLIDNSLRYAGRDSIVTVAITIEDDRQVCLSIEDNGPGVPAEFLARLGERFFRVPGCHEEGTGLGLAIVQRIAERHRARVHYLSSNEGGLRVEILFPPAQTGKG